ncbi:HAMP domain-containing protein [Oerskovia sp. M15]
MVGILGLITWVVTRQAVQPVRNAANVAERLADGHLNERLPVKGHDELATLARSFNEMAEGLQLQIGRMEELSLLQRRFVSDVSHELRTPLTTIRMAGEVLHASRENFDPRRSGRPSCSRPSWTGSRISWRTSWRSAGSTPGPRSSTRTAGTCATWSTPPSISLLRSPSARACGCRCTSRSRRRRPTWTRGASSGSCATSWSTRSSTRTSGRSRSRSLRTATPWPSSCATTASG